MHTIYYLKYNKNNITVDKGQIEKALGEYKSEVIPVYKNENIYYIRKGYVFYSITKAQELAKERNIIERFKNTHEHVCVYCGKKIENESDLTVDHITPRSKGGKTKSSNLAISCYNCNQDKEATNPFVYINVKVKSQMRKENLSKKKTKKIGRTISSTCDNIEYLAKHDSPYWDVSLFFSKNPYKLANQIGC